MALESDLHRNGWALESAEERHLAAPDRFIIPSQHERASLGVGSRVKLLFLILGHDGNGDYIQCERLWVTVIEVNEKHYIGILESRPVTSDVLSPGARVAFDPEHIATVLIPGVSIIDRF